MDAQKHAWPRSRSMNSKEFCSFNRPRLASTSLIIHGFSVTVALSPHTTSTNSSRTAELLSFGLSRLASKVDFRKVFLSVQADNCTKELKNVTNLRMMAMWVALHKLSGGEMSFLSSGHSHEDIDAMFNLIRAWIESHREIWTPTAFQHCLQRFFDQTTGFMNPFAMSFWWQDSVTGHLDWVGELIHSLASRFWNYFV